ncbi:MAG: SurA N-terminal domain-containing protein [Actinomycetes bacterium]|nr:SurA N-terminal domain-containing protein [Actinomycetes bacterium]
MTDELGNVEGIESEIAEEPDVATQPEATDAEAVIETIEAEDPEAVDAPELIAAPDADVEDLDFNWGDDAEDVAGGDDGADITLPEGLEGAEEAPKKKTGLYIGIAAAAVVVIAVIVFCIVKFGGGGIGNGDVAAKVNGDKITIAQLDAEIAKIKLQNPTIFDTAQGGMEEGAVRQTLLNELINRVLIEQEAAKQGIEVTDAEVTEQVDAIKAGYADETAFNEAMEGAGYTLDTLQTQIKYDLYARALIEKQVPDSSVTDEEIKEYYEQNKDTFVEAAGKRASHILFAADDKSTAEKVLKDLKKSTDLEKDFAAAAKEHSTDTASAANGGDLGWPTSAYVENFQKALDKLDVDEMSDLVKTEYGYHIILVTDERNESTQKLEDVTDQIRDTLLNQKKNDAYTKMLEDLNAAAKIEILDPQVKEYEAKQEAEAASTTTDSGTDAATTGDTEATTDAETGEAATE